MNKILFGKLTVNVYRSDKVEMITVHNESIMSKKVQAQVFERSFSTKGAGRGIGTYSVKLLPEKYLTGRTWFESEEGIGTRFYVELHIEA